MIKISIASLKNYFHNRTKKDEEGNLVNVEFYEQVMTEEGCKRLSECWSEYGSELEYLREILEYVQITDGNYTREQQELIKETNKKQNLFLERCLERQDLDAEFNQIDDAEIIQ